MKILVAIVMSVFILSGIAPSFAQVTSPGFTNAVSISNPSADSQSPQMVVSADGISIVWVENTLGRSDPYFSKSTDGGFTFSSPIDLSGSSGGQSSSPMLVQKDKNIYVVWQSALSGNSTVFFTKSSDGGNSFEKPALISDALKLSAFPQIDVSDNHVYFAWLEKSDNDTNIVFAKSDDTGNSFVAPLYVTHNAGNSGIPKIFANGNQVYLAWEDNSKGNFEVFLSKSDDYGASFHTPVDVSDNVGQSGTPQIVVSKDTIYAVWMDNTSGNYDILFAKSTDGGKSFGTPVNISNLHGDSGYPQFTVSGNNVYVTWTQTISAQNYDVFFAKSSDNGETFDKPVNLSNNFGSSGWPKIASDGNVYVSWVDSSLGKFHIFITKSSDGGMTFENYTNVSHAKNESYDNKMTVLDNTVYMVWQEGQKGNYSIVFSKSTTFVPEFGPFASIALVVSVIAIIALSFRSNLRLKC